MKKVEELSAAENTRMDELCERLSDADRLLEECCWFGDEDRSVVENVVKNMREKIASGRDRVALVVNVMKKAIKARVLIDKVYRFCYCFFPGFFDHPYCYWFLFIRLLQKIHKMLIITRTRC